MIPEIIASMWVEKGFLEVYQGESWKQILNYRKQCFFL